MIFLKQYYLSCLSHASYLVGDLTTGRAVVVDPQRDVEQYLDDAVSNGLKIERVIQTHIHADFVSGQLEIAQATGATISYGHTSNTTFAFPVDFLSHYQQLALGEVELTILATPGHTEESICIHIADSRDGYPGAVLTGDTLFIGDVGRPDLVSAKDADPAKMARVLYYSLHEHLLTLPDETIVYPAHGAGSACGKRMSTEIISTIGEQRLTNYALQPMNIEKFVELVLSGQTPPPQYFGHAAAKNRQMHQSAEGLRFIPSLDRKETEGFGRSGVTLLDVRVSAEFATGHLLDSINVGLDGRFAEYVGQVVDAKSDIVIIGHRGDEIEAALRLSRIGFDSVVGVHYIEAIGAPSFSQRLNAEMVSDYLADEGRVQILDVRTSGEVASGMIPGALHLPLSELTKRSQELPPYIPTIVYCAGGYRSSIAASLLRSLGFNVLGDLIGGIGAWTAAELPLDVSSKASSEASSPASASCLASSTPGS